MAKSRSKRQRPSRAPKIPLTSVSDEVFIMEGQRNDMARFVVSVRSRGDMLSAAKRHGLASRPIKVAHWQKRYGYGHDPMAGWSLVERFPL